MQAEHLLSDELAIECEVRGISGSVTDCILQLNAALAAEVAGTKPLPVQAHARARKRPKKEVDRCKVGLKALYACLHAEMHTEANSDSKVFSVLKSRLSHLVMSLQRLIVCSPSSHKPCKFLLKTCEQVMDTIVLAQSEVTAGEKSFDSAKAVIVDFADGSSSDSDAGEETPTGHKPYSEKQQGPPAAHSSLLQGATANPGGSPVVYGRDVQINLSSSDEEEMTLQAMAKLTRYLLRKQSKSGGDLKATIPTELTNLLSTPREPVMQPTEVNPAPLPLPASASGLPTVSLSSIVCRAPSNISTHASVFTTIANQPQFSQALVSGVYTDGIGRRPISSTFEYLSEYQPLPYSNFVTNVGVGQPGQLPGSSVAYVPTLAIDPWSAERAIPRSQTVPSITASTPSAMTLNRLQSHVPGLNSGVISSQHSGHLPYPHPTFPQQNPPCVSSYLSQRLDNVLNLDSGMPMNSIPNVGFTCPPVAGVSRDYFGGNPTQAFATQHQNVTPQQFATQAANYSQCHNLARSACPDVTKWGLRFDPASDDWLIERFVYQIERKAKRHFTNLDLFVEELGPLLLGRAKSFYFDFLQRHGEVSWEQLKLALIERFQIRRTDNDVKRSMDSRKQKVRESFLEFYHDLLSLSLSLRTPLSEDDLMNILTRNMRLGLQVDVAGKTFRNLAYLVQHCVSTEDAWNRIGHIPELLLCRKGVSELAHDGTNFDSYSPDPNSWSIQEDTVAALNDPRRLPHTQGSSKPYGSQTKRPTSFTCYNCHIDGHSYRDCPITPQGPFCYGCGKRDVLKPHCGNCTPGTGNMTGEVRKPVSASFPKPPPVTRPSMEDAATNVDPELAHLPLRHS